MSGRRAPALTVAGRRTLQALVPLLLLVALVSWALSSPVGSSPDDDFHLASIWCQGERPGVCERTGDDAERRIPGDVAASVCYAFAPEESAACQEDDLDSLAGEPLVTSDRGNFAHLYPPVFYAAMGLFAGDSLIDGVLVMRVVNALLYVGLLTAVVVAVPSWLRPPAVLGAVVTAVPFGVFLVPSTNPSSWALLSAATFWVSLLGLAFSRGRRAAVLGALVLVSAVVGAGARADSLFFLVMAALAVGALVLRRRGARWWVYPALVAALVVAALFFSTATQGEQAASGLPNDGAPPRTLRELLLLNVTNAPALWAGMFGQWGLGWLDTAMPGGTWVLAGAAVAAVVMVGLGSVDARKLVAVAGAGVALWLVPVVLLVQTNALVGEHVQPRYLLPIAVLMVGLATLPTLRGAPRFTVTQVAVVAGGLAVANTLALHAQIRRYVTGTDHVAVSLGFKAEWWWDGLPGPDATWVVGSVSFAAGLAALAVLWLADRDRWELPAGLVSGAATDEPAEATPAG